MEYPPRSVIRDACDLTQLRSIGRRDPERSSRRLTNGDNCDLNMLRSIDQQFTPEEEARLTGKYQGGQR